MAKKGKCDDCRRLYHWPDETLLANTLCPTCGRGLKRTTVNCKYPAYTLCNSDVERVQQKRKNRFTVCGLLFFLLLLPVGPKAANAMYAGITVTLDGKVYPAFSLSVDHGTPNQVNKFRPGEMHHGYIGAALLLIPNKWTRSIGAVLLADDLAQHVFRINTPVHMVSDELGRYHWYRQLSQAVNL